MVDWKYQGYMILCQSVTHLASCIMTNDELETVPPADGSSFSSREEEVGRPPATGWAAGDVAPDLKRDFLFYVNL